MNREHSPSLSRSNKTSHDNDLVSYGNQQKHQKVFAPSPFYSGPRPAASCELYVTNLPGQFDFYSFYCWLCRCGAVYEMRIMMKTEDETRGFCFILFFGERSAAAAFELLSFLFLNGRRPHPQWSQCKRLLYVGGIPKNLNIENVKQDFQRILPTISKCIVSPASPGQIKSNERNRGIAFLEFSDHDAALKAKKLLKIQHIFGRIVNTDWAKQPEHNELISVSRKNDYCAKLRLYSIANNWCIPIVVYGNNFKKHDIQYAGILLKDSVTAEYSCIVVEVHEVSRLFDIHLLICEIATHLVEVICGMPQKHYIIRARRGETAKILFSFIHLHELINLDIKSKIFFTSVISISSVVNLVSSLDLLAQFQSEAVLMAYKLSFRSIKSFKECIASFCLLKSYQNSEFYSVYPKFRNNSALNNNFNDIEIILIQASATGDEMECRPSFEIDKLLSVRIADEGAFLLKSQRYNNHIGFTLNFVDVKLLKSNAFYHPAQRLNTPPLWVQGEIYQKSLFDLI